MIDINMSDIELDFGFKKILNKVTFSVLKGEKVALVGCNGSGKTSLLRIMMGQIKNDKGSCTIRKDTTLGYLDQTSDIGDETAMVEVFLKSAMENIFTMEAKLRTIENRMATEHDKLEKLLAEYDRLQNQFSAMGGYEAEETFNKICSVFKIGETMLKMKCGELSGGQRTIIKLAKVLLEAPDILLLDEPTNHLDVETLEWLENFIRNYKGTVILISHDRYFLDKTINKTILLYRGQVEIYNGNYTFCLQEQERLTMLEFEEYKTQQRQIEAMKAAIKRFREWGERADDARFFKKARNMEKRIERMELVEKPQNEKKLPIHFEMKNRSAKRVLTIEDLCFNYQNKPMFSNACADIIFKEKVCLLGANGTGKTTLLNLILGKLSPTSGSIHISESANIGYIPQKISFEDENATILSAFKNYATVHENEARRLLARFFITKDDVYKRLNALSGGERVILRLAMIMQKPINLLILDEPTNHLDIDTKELLEESLAEYQGTLFFISHDRYFINRLATRVFNISNMGLTSVNGNYDDFSALTTLAK